MPGGRPAKPTKLLKLTDTYRADRHGARLEVVSSIPTCPDFLDIVGKRKWKELVKELKPTGILSRLDRDMLAMACAAYSEYIWANNAIKKDGNRPAILSDKGGYYTNPVVNVRVNAWSRYVKALVEFGMSPVARTKLVVVKEGEVDVKGKGRFFQKKKHG